MIAEKNKQKFALLESPGQDQTLDEESGPDQGSPQNLGQETGSGQGSSESQMSIFLFCSPGITQYKKYKRYICFFFFLFFSDPEDFVNCLVKFNKNQYKSTRILLKFN